MTEPYPERFPQDDDRPASDIEAPVAQTEPPPNDERAEG
jgi:hypothetical protein